MARSFVRGSVIFVGATVSAGLLAFVSISSPYSSLQITFLVIGSLIAGVAALAVETGIRGDANRPGGYGAPVATAPPTAAAPGASRPDYSRILTSTVDSKLIGRNADLAQLGALLDGQQGEDG